MHSKSVKNKNFLILCNNFFKKFENVNQFGNGLAVTVKS